MEPYYSASNDYPQPSRGYTRGNFISDFKAGGGYHRSISRSIELDALILKIMSHKENGMKVLALGGYGEFGLAAVELLARSEGISKVTIAGRNLARAQQAAAQMGAKSTRLSSTPMMKRD